MTAPLSADQQARLERIEAAEAAPESLRERVARAMAQTEYESVIDEDAWEYAFDEIQRDEFRDYADAAIAVLRGPSVADEALRRVASLPDEWEAAAEMYDAAAADGRARGDLWTEGGHLIQAGDARRFAQRLRAALNGGDR